MVSSLSGATGKALDLFFHLRTKRFRQNVIAFRTDRGSRRRGSRKRGSRGRTTARVGQRKREHVVP